MPGRIFCYLCHKFSDCSQLWHDFTDPTAGPGGSVPAGYYPAGGYRRLVNGTDALTTVSTWGHYWSSSSSVSTAGEAYDWYFAATGQQAHYVDHPRDVGMAVRCLQAFTSHFSSLFSAWNKPAARSPRLRRAAI